MPLEKISRRTLGAAIAAAVLALAGCGGEEKPQGAAPQASADAQKTLIPIGIVQLVEHDALDAAVRGIIDGLAERGYKEGERITIDRQNAQADQSNLHNIGTRFASAGNKVIFAVATPAAQAMATAAKDIPIVGTAITDFVSAKLVKSDDAPGGNVTGVSDMGPIEKQFELLAKLVPNMKTVGTIYNSSEVNSAVQVKLLKDAAAAAGVEVLEATVSSVNDIQQAATSLKGKVDALYLPTDNVIASAVPVLAKIVDPAKIPTVAGEVGMVRNGCLASVSVDYYTLGKMTGEMGADILDGKSTPAKMPIRRQLDGELVINMKTAKAIGITIPEDLLSKATKFE